VNVSLLIEAWQLYSVVHYEVFFCVILLVHLVIEC